MADTSELLVLAYHTEYTSSYQFKYFGIWTCKIDVNLSLMSILFRVCRNGP